MKKTQKKLERIAATLPVIDGAKPESFVHDGKLFVNGEAGDGLVDFYGEFHGGYPYIHPTLKAWAEKRGCYWEWQTVGCIVLCI